MQYLHGCIRLFSLSPVLASLAPALVPAPALVRALVPAPFRAPVPFPFLSPSLGVPGRVLSPAPSPNWQRRQLLCEPNGLRMAITQTDTPRTHINKTQRLMIGKRVVNSAPRKERFQKMLTFCTTSVPSDVQLHQHCIESIYK